MLKHWEEPENEAMTHRCECGHVDMVMWSSACTCTCMYRLSLIHISEPTRRYAISYAVFCLKTSSYYDDTNDVSTTYLGTYLDGNKPRAFNFENDIPMDGRGIARANLMDQTPLKVFFDSGATRSYLSPTFYKVTTALDKL